MHLKKKCVDQSFLPELVNILIRYQVSDEYEPILFIGDSLFWSQEIRVKSVSADKPEHTLQPDQELTI